MAITKSSFGITSDGEEAFLYRLENTSGAYVTITSFGCRIVSICVPDREGELRDVCLGYDTLAEYEKDTASFGAVVGRHANRIEKGVFTLNDVCNPFFSILYANTSAFLVVPKVIIFSEFLA